MILRMKKEKNLKKYVKISLQVLTYSLVIYFIWTRINNVDDIWENIRNVDMFFLSLSVTLFTLQTLYNSYLWYYLMKESGEKVDVNGQMDTYLSSYLLRYIPGNIVGILSRGELNRKYGVSRLKSLWGWFLENITYLLVAMSLGSYFVFKNLSEVVGLTEVITSRTELITYGGIVIVVFMVITTLLLMFKTNYLWKLFNHYIINKLLKKNLGKDVEVRLTNRSRILIVLGYFMSWLIYSASFLSLVYSVAPGSLEFFLSLSSLNALAWSFGYLFIITPSGTGVREGVLIALLPAIFGISPVNAAIIALTMRLVTVAGEIGAFLIHKGYNFYIKVTKHLS